MLVTYGSGLKPYELTLAGHGTSEQAAKMAEMAQDAFRAWKTQGHPGWSVDSMDSHQLQQLDQRLDQQQVEP